MTAPTLPYREVFVITDARPGYYACNTCGTDVDTRPCPDHAPMAVPGLLRVHCDAPVPHVAFIHDSEADDTDCPYCCVKVLHARLGELDPSWPWASDTRSGGWSGWWQRAADRMRRLAEGAR